MTYEQLYLALCHHYQTHAALTGYTEVHHVIPRHEGGSNASENLVTLSYSHHLLAHILFAKWKQTPQAWGAVMLMVSISDRHGVNVDIAHAAQLREQERAVRLYEKLSQPKAGKQWIKDKLRFVKGQWKDFCKGVARTDFDESLTYQNTCDTFCKAVGELALSLTSLPGELEKFRAEIEAQLSVIDLDAIKPFSEIPRYRPKDRKLFEEMEREIIESGLAVDADFDTYPWQTIQKHQWQLLG